MEPHSVSHQHRKEEIVDSADHNRSAYGQDASFQPVPIQSQEEGDRNPDYKGAQHWHDGERAHHHAPQQRCGQAKPPEYQSAKSALHGSDDQGSIYRRMNSVSDPAD